MKKFLLTLATAALLAGSAVAETYTFTPTGMEGSSVVTNVEPQIAGFSFSAMKNNGSTAPAFSTSGNDLRIYAQGTFSIIIPAGVTVNQVVFNISTQGKKRLAPITVDDGTIATQVKGDDQVTWNGQATESISFTVGEKADYGSDGSSKAGQLCFSSFTIDLTVGGNLKEVCGLEFSETNCKAYIGENFNAPMLSNPNNLTGLSWNSSHQEVATVSDTGDVILKNVPGETVITVTFDGNDQYLAGSASYTLEVIDPNATEFTFDFHNETYGFNRSSNTYENDKEITDATETIQIVNNKISGNGWRLWTDGLRGYKGEISLTISSLDPTRYISSIEFEGSAVSSIETSNESEWTSDKKTWTGMEMELSVVLKPTETVCLSKIIVHTGERKAIANPKLKEIVGTDDEPAAVFNWNEDGSAVISMPANKTVQFEAEFPAAFNTEKLSNLTNFVVVYEPNSNHIEYEYLINNKLYIKPTEGTYTFTLDFLSNEKLPILNTTFGPYTFNVHPNLNEHFNYSEQDWHNASMQCVIEGENRYFLKHPGFEQTNANNEYIYKYMVVTPSRQVRRAEEAEDGWKTYNHKNGIELPEGNHTVLFTAEKNGITAPNPVAVNVITSNFATGVAALEAENSEAVYFDMMGRRVAEPSEGIFIKVQNGKAVKINK